MTSVYVKCLYSGVSIDLKREPPGDVLHVNEGLFGFPGGRTITLISDVQSYGREVNVEAVDGDLVVNGAFLARGGRVKFSITKDHPVVIKAL